ncbi:MAG: carbohydrate kinase [Bacteroidales bacterium]|nr:carbohydrate kinase [Bacteroidales bacterium]
MDRYIVGIGEALWDCLPEGREVGGAPLNFAFHVGRFGMKALAVSAVGDDPLGRELKEKLAQKGVECMFETVEYPTGTVQVEVDAQGIPSYNIKEDVAWDHIPFTPRMEEIACNCRAVCFGTLAQRSEVSRSTIRRFIQAMPSTEDTYRIFDINLRQHYYSKELIEESLQMCNVLKINDEELDVLKQLFKCRKKQHWEVCKSLMNEWDLKVVILTCGTKGSYIYTHNEATFERTDVIEGIGDTVGAGDSFTAAFIASHLHGDSLSVSHMNAVRMSGYVCTQKGAMPDYEFKLSGTSNIEDSALDA